MTLEVVTGARLRLAPVTLPASHLKIPIHYIVYGKVTPFTDEYEYKWQGSATTLCFVWILFQSRVVLVVLVVGMPMRWDMLRLPVQCLQRGGAGGELEYQLFSEMRFIQGVLALKVEGSVVI